MKLFKTKTMNYAELSLGHLHAANICRRIEGLTDQRALLVKSMQGDAPSEAMTKLTESLDRKDRIIAELKQEYNQVRTRL